MNFSKPDNIIYINIGNSKEAVDKLRTASGDTYFETESIIQISHQRDADELIHQSIKELANKEKMPFKSFGMNRAYYFMLVITQFLFEAYKQDVTIDVVPITTYTNTFRRKLFDFTEKITSRVRSIKLNVSRTIYETTNFNNLWERCQSPPPIQYA